MVAFPKKDEDEIVLVCRGCGCMSFYLHEDQRIQCTSCDHWIDNTGTDWRKQFVPLDDADKEKLEDTKGLVTKQVIGSKEFARAIVVKTITDAVKDDELALVMSYRNNGAGQHWTDIKTQADKDWIIEKVNFFLDYLNGVKINEQEGTGEAKEEVAPPSGSGVE